MSVRDVARSVLPPEALVLGGRLLPNNRAQRADVVRNLVVPETLRRHRRRRRGSVWAVAMMRNEADTARHVIEHLLAQDVDAVLVADNRSTDDTLAVLTALSEEHPVHVVRDHLEAYAQAAKMTALSSVARRCGAEWIVPFDADELWFAAGRTVGSFLRSSDAAVVWATIHNVFPSPDDDPHEPNPFLRLRHVDPNPDPVRKLAFRAHPLAKIANGNMEIVRRGRRTTGLFVAHYPWRSVEQMTGKLRRGKAVMEVTNEPEGICLHWRVGGAWTDEQLAEAWEDLQAGRPVEDLNWSPTGAGRAEDPGPGPATWPTWPAPEPLAGSAARR